MNSNPSKDSKYKENINWEYYNPPEDSTPVQCCLDSSLHGLQYIGQQNRHCFERIFWLIAFTSSVVCAGGLIYVLWENYRNSPIVTVFSPIETELWNIAFPAVTFCNVNRLLDSLTEKYKQDRLLFKNSEDQTSYLKSTAALQDISDICEVGTDTIIRRMVASTSTKWTDWYDNFTEDFEKRKDEFEKYINPSKLLADVGYQKIIKKISQNCSEMLVFCMWKDEVKNCNDLFRPIMTDYGYCCTFNMIPPTLLMKDYNDSRDNPVTVKEWAEAEVTSDNLILTSSSDYNPHTFPYRQLYPSRSSGLSVMLEPNLTEYCCTSIDSEGFVVGLKVPLDFPRMREDVMVVQPGLETFMKIHPQITMSDSSIRKFPLEKRNCYFDDEYEHTSLKHHTKYTATNCLSECVSHMIQARCDCVRYYMPRSPHVPLCKPEKYVCAREAEKDATDGEDHCLHCHRSCTDIQYQAEVTALPIREFHTNKLFAAYPNRKKTQNLTIVHIYFGQQAYQTRLRKESYSIIDLISSAGGLLGLCMGFSMLSVLEILYYLTLRLCFIYRRKYIEKESTRVTPNPHFYYGEMMQNSQSKQWSQSPAVIKDCKDPIFKLVQSHTAWKPNT